MDRHLEKGAATNLAEVRTNERVPGHTAYFEKDGIRTYGDGQDHDHEPPVCFILQALGRHTIPNTIP